MSETADGVIWGVEMPFGAGTIRAESGPHGFRLARKPDGELVLQGAFQWWDGLSGGGEEWRTLPTVPVNENGVEATRELDASGRVDADRE